MGCWQVDMDSDTDSTQDVDELIQYCADESVDVTSFEQARPSQLAPASSRSQPAALLAPVALDTSSQQPSATCTAGNHSIPKNSGLQHVMSPSAGNSECTRALHC